MAVVCSSNRFARLLNGLLAASLCLYGGGSVLAEEESGEAEGYETAEEAEYGLDEDVIEENEPEETEETIIEETEEPAEGLIIAVEEIGFEELSFETKPEWNEVLAQLPSSLNVTVKNEGEETETALAAEWKCLEDYEKGYKNYTLVPFFEAYHISIDAAVPSVKLIIEDGIEAPNSGYMEVDRGFEIPSVELDERLRGFLPAQYSSLDKKKLPPIRNQGQEGACWAFAGVGAVEADLIHDNKVYRGAVDYSELQIAYFSTHTHSDPKGNFRGDSATWLTSGSYLDNGGNLEIVGNMMANNIGPVNEKDAPYSNGSRWTPGNHLAVSSNAAQLKRYHMINPTDRDSVKQANIDHGGVGVSFYADSVYYSRKYNSYLSNQKTSNHAVMLVGWNDNFPRSNFAPYTPSGNGAWLVRNSWGYEGMGFEGYFYISYEDTSLNQSTVYGFDADTERYDHVYAYDRFPLSSWYYSVSSPAVVTTTYTVDRGEYVNAVGILAADANLDVDVKVTDGYYTANGTGRTTYAGFYTIPLDLPFPATRNTVTVTVTYRARSGSSVMVLMEPQTTSWYGDVQYVGALSGPGFTLNGQKCYYDARIKLYTKDRGTPPPTPTPTPTPTIRPTPTPTPTTRPTPTPTAAPTPTPSSDTIDMYRMYNPNSGEHFYTGSAAERDSLRRSGWNYEGVGFRAFVKSNTPMYRLYNPNAGDHHYTSSTQERDYLLRIGWKDEGIGWYAGDTHGLEMARLYNPNALGAGAHHYTSDWKERNYLIKSGWKYEGLGFYAAN